MDQQTLENIRAAAPDIARRGELAYRYLIESIQRNGNVTEAEATIVADYYLKNRMAKLDHVMGTGHVRSGNLLEPETIAEALAIATT